MKQTHKTEDQWISEAHQMQATIDNQAKELRQIESLFFGGFLEDTEKDGLAWRLFEEVQSLKKKLTANP